MSVLKLVSIVLRGVFGSLALLVEFRRSKTPLPDDKRVVIRWELCCRRWTNRSGVWLRTRGSVLTHLQLEDTSIEASRRAAIEKAIVEAVNAALQQVVKASANTLSALHCSEEWKAAMGEMFGGTGAR
jgi:hypothetical protein